MQVLDQKKKRKTKQNKPQVLITKRFCITLFKKPLHREAILKRGYTLAVSFSTKGRKDSFVFIKKSHSDIFNFSRLCDLVCQNTWGYGGRRGSYVLTIGKLFFPFNFMTPSVLKYFIPWPLSSIVMQFLTLNQFLKVR
jgi:hypothetical protein